MNLSSQKSSKLRLESGWNLFIFFFFTSLILILKKKKYIELKSKNMHYKRAVGHCLDPGQNVKTD